MTNEQRKHLVSAVARLKREIKALRAKPLKPRSAYTEARHYKRALSIRQNAINDRRRLIADYSERIKKKN